MGDEPEENHMIERYVQARDNQALLSEHMNTVLIPLTVYSVPYFKVLMVEIA